MGIELLNATPVEQPAHGFIDTFWEIEKLSFLCWKVFYVSNALLKTSLFLQFLHNPPAGVECGAAMYASPLARECRLLAGAAEVRI